MAIVATPLPCRCHVMATASNNVNKCHNDDGHVAAVRKQRARAQHDAVHVHVHVHVGAQRSPCAHHAPNTLHNAAHMRAQCSACTARAKHMGTYSCT
eukprot:4969947-Lingulodinium_polyedra.AAC.1